VLAWITLKSITGTAAGFTGVLYTVILGTVDKTAMIKLVLASESVGNGDTWSKQQTVE
jgi:hypothetical protein